MCNKLASRHVRVGLANPSDVSRCDICENAPGMETFMYRVIYYFLCPHGLYLRFKLLIFHLDPMSSILLL